MTTTDTKKQRIPTPLYAAAGAGDMAYRQLRKLPAKVAELRERVGGSEVDVDRLRVAARRNAQAFVSGAQAAQERAQAIYADLVARGEEVVRGRNGDDLKTTAELPATATPAPAEAKPAKKAKPAAE
jgi:heparin binding hemagglutinin HbhA